VERSVEISAEDRAASPDEFFWLWVLIAQTKDAILRARERDYARYGISNERRAVLFLIDSNGGSSTPSEIARGLFRELHSTTELLKRMEADDLVVRRKANGGSRVRIELTDKGKDVLVQSLYNEVDKRIFSVLTRAEREQMAASLWKLRNRTFKELGLAKWRFKFPLDPYTKEVGDGES
jgi:DNA-binding MarR family transcriptional regulator